MTEKILSLIGKHAEYFMIPAVPHLFVPIDEALTHSKHAQEAGLEYNFIIQLFYNKGKKAFWIFDRNFVIEKGKLIEQDAALIEMEWKNWLNAEKEAQECLKKLESKGITDIKKDYLYILEANLKVWEFGIIPQFFIDYSDEVMGELNKKYPSYPKEIHSMSAPLQKSMVANQQQDFLKACIEFKNQGKIKETSQEFSKKYYWSRTNYLNSPKLTAEKTEEEIREQTSKKKLPELENEYSKLQNYSQSLREKQEGIEKSEIFEQESIQRMKTLALMTRWQDRRKASGLKATYWLNQAIKQAASETSKDPVALQFMLPEEFINHLNGKKTDWEKIKSRTKKCGIARFAGKKQVWLDDKQIDAVKQVISREEHTTEDTKGLIASRGKAVGKARVITDPHKQKIEEGEILISHMTRPDYVPLMKKSGAIVTDEGGITCHAAIIARELGIPCIVGTKISTKIFKNGDLVEVNAENGTVRKIR